MADAPDKTSVDAWLQRVARVADLDPAPPIDVPELPVVERERYRILGEHARGGMGRVLIAEDLRLGRRVAIKEILPKRNVNVVRFIREALVTARLEHPSIVPVHEIGRWPSGEPFYVMKFVAGRAFDRVLAELRTFDERLAHLPTLIAVAEAIAYAHSHRVVHRDLKPSNIMIGEFGEALVVDWGLAKRLGEGDQADGSLDGGAPAATLTGAVVGTPGFMAPEQAAGAPVDERADLFAVGAIAYHLFAGEPPYRGSTVKEVLEQVRSGPPVPLAVRVPAVPRDLAAVIAKAMAGDPAARYASARELAADLRRVQTGSLVAARRYSRSERLIRWVLRNRVPVGAATAALLAIAAIGGVSVRRVVRERTVALAERARAEEARATVQARVDELTLTQARAAADADPTAALAWLKRLRPGSPRWSDARAVAQAAVARGGAAAAIVAARHFAFAPDGRLAVADALGRVRIDGAARTVDGGGPVEALAFARDGRLWLAARSVRVFAPDGRALDRWDLAARELAIAPDGAHALAAGDSGVAWLAPGGAVLRLDTSPSSAPRVSPDGTLLAARAPDGVRLWSAGGTPRRLSPRVGGDGGLAFSPDGRQLAAAADGGVIVWELDSGRARRLAAGGRVVALAFSPDGARLAACSDDGAAWLTTLDGTVTPLSHRGADCRDIAFSSDGHWLASTRGPMARLWSTDTLALRKLRGHAADLAALAFAPDGARLATLAPDDGVRVWRPREAGAPPDGEAALRAWLDATTDATIGDDGRFHP